MRLIDAEALEKDFYDNYDKKGYRNGKSLIYAAWCLLKKLIDKAPTIEAKPVVHAHWEYDPNGMDWGIGAWRCSKCRCKNDNLPNQNWTSIYQFAGSKYCPNCGAEMTEGD